MLEKAVNPLVDMQETYSMALSMLKAYQQVLWKERDLVPAEHQATLVKLNAALFRADEKSRLLEKQLLQLESAQKYYKEKSEKEFLDAICKITPQTPTTILTRVLHLFR